MQDFLFHPGQARTQISALSGGERGRLMLARVFAQPSNVLVLDEPTNDLDLETLDLLQERLAEYLGTVVVVSHDRDFLDRVVTSVIVSEGNGKWTEYAGGYTDMSFQRRKVVNEDLLQRKRSKTFKTKDKNQKTKRRIAKLSYKDQHALEALPAEIEKLQSEVKMYHSILADNDLFASDPVKFQATANALNAAEAKLAEAEDRWLNLEIWRDEINGR